MYRIVIIALSLSICVASDDIQSRMDKLMKSIQEKYQIYSPEDLHKLTSRSNTNNRSFSSSDMDDLFGEWFVEEENYEMYVTVGSDQSIPNMMQMTAMMEAEGNVTATASDYETELTYMLYASMLEMDNGDNDDDDDTYSYGPRIGMYLTDLDPSGGGIYFDETDAEATITFVDVPLLGGGDGLNTFQVQLFYSSGEIIISYKDLSLTGSNTEQAPGGLAIGIANGEGDYDEVDLSESAGESYSFPVEGYSDSNELDLAYKQITFTPNSDFSEYSVSATTITGLPASYSNEITVEDDDYTEQSLSSYFEFYGNSYNQIYINNDGNIGFEDGDDTCVCSACDDGDGDCAAAYLSGEGDIDHDPLFLGEDDYNAFSTLIYAQNYTALIFAQDYVDDYSSNHGQSSFELDSVFNLVIEGDNVSGGLGGDNPGNCEINWPEDPYRMAVYSFVSEYVLSEGGSVGCFVDDVTLDQTFAYVALEMESLWSGGDDGDDGDDDSDLFIMNFDVLNFFLFMFGMPPEGVDNPLMVMINFEEEIVAAQGLTAFGQDPDIYIADPSDFESSVSFDMDEQTLIITELSLMDSTETAVLSLNGTIGPGMIDLVAGVSTEIPGLDMEILGEELEAPEVYMVFHEDSTGMIIEIEEDEDYGDMIDTSYFDWFATSDSLWLFDDEWICDGGEGYTDSFASEEECNEECNTDCYYDEDNDGMALYYEFSDDTLFISVTEYPCEDFNDYDECIEEGEMDLFIGELEDIQDFYIHNTLVMLPTGDDVSLADVTVMPEKFTIHQNYPNPFNPVTTLRYDLPENGNVNITIYDMLGRQVKTLINQNQDAGYRSVIWNATNNYGEPVSAGIYLYQIQAGEYMQTKKMVLLK